jgi:hypothetical protein
MNINAHGDDSRREWTVGDRDLSCEEIAGEAVDEN